MTLGTRVRLNDYPVQETRMTHQSALLRSDRAQYRWITISIAAVAILSVAQLALVTYSNWLIGHSIETLAPSYSDISAPLLPPFTVMQVVLALAAVTVGLRAGVRVRSGVEARPGAHVLMVTCLAAIAVLSIAAIALRPDAAPGIVRHTSVDRQLQLVYSVDLALCLLAAVGSRIRRPGARAGARGVDGEDMRAGRRWVR
jgi:hypothetical protein